MTRTLPSLAIVVPVADPGDRLDGLLGRLDAVIDDVDEIVVVADGADADVATRLESWSAVRPTVLVEYLAERRGVAAARNHALERVSADYVWFIDDDDEWDATAVSVISLHLRYRPDVLVFRAEYRFLDGSPGRIVDGLDIDETTTGAAALTRLLRGRIHGFLWSKVFRRDRLSSPLFPDLSSQSDVVGVARAFSASRRVRFIPDVLYTYVRRTSSITRTRTPDFGNLLAARDLVLEAAVTLEDVVIDRAVVDYFAAWFYCSAVLKTVVRQHVSPAERTRALAAAREVARSLDAPSVRASSLRHGLVLVALRASPTAAAAATAVAYAALDGSRRVLAGRRRARASALVAGRPTVDEDTLRRPTIERSP